MLVAGSVSGAGTGPSEQAALAVVNANEQAIRLDQFDRGRELVSDDCTDHAVDRNQDGKILDKTRSCKQGIEEGREAVRAMNASGAMHKYESTVTSMVVVGDKATAHLHVAYIVKNADHSMKVGAEDVETLELRNGKWYITSVDEKSTSLTVDGRRIY